jgi:hypothetical protein
MQYQSRLYRRCEVMIMIIRCATSLATPWVGDTTNNRTASVSNSGMNSGTPENVIEQQRGNIASTIQVHEK